MNDYTLEELKKTHLEQQKIKQQITELELAVKQKLTKEALQRYGNIKAAYPDKAVQLLVRLAQNLDKFNTINDSQLKEILKQMTPKKREFKIRRK